MQKGFTLIELIVTIAIMAILSGIVLLSVVVYINKGKDSNIQGNLAILIPAGEAYYNGNNSYDGFCTSSVVKNVISQLPPRSLNTTNCYGSDQDPNNWTGTSNIAGLCCSVGKVVVDNDAWAACAKEFADTNSAFCVDSRGVKKSITISDCERIRDGTVLQCL